MADYPTLFAYRVLLKEEQDFMQSGLGAPIHSIKVTVWQGRNATQIQRWMKRHCSTMAKEISYADLLGLRQLCGHLLQARDPKEARKKLPGKNGEVNEEFYWKELEGFVVSVDKALTARPDMHWRWRYELL